MSESPSTQSQLAAAYARLSAEGRRPTVRALKSAAHVSTDAAARFLRDVAISSETPAPPDLSTPVAAIWAAAWQAARDAARAEAAALPLQDSHLREPRADDGVRAAVKVLLASRDHMSTERTATINALTALLRVVDLGIDARRPLTATQIAMIAAWQPRDEDIATATARGEANRLAKRVAALDTELKDITKRITDLVRQSPASGLLDQPGIGPITAAVALTSWSHLGRIRSEAAFASLAGTNPIPASSGNTVRHRINRGGDRRLNRALHMAIVTRMRMDPRTRAYVERRTAEGRTIREIRRCLKRYLAREIYRHLNTAARAQLATT